jgi:ribosomal protein L29
MKKNMTNIREKTGEQLLEELARVREDLRIQRFSSAGARAKDPSEFAKSRAQVARILTELGSRATNAQKESAPVVL